VSRQEELPTNKTERASDRGAVGRKLGVSRGNARRAGEMGTQNRGKLARGAPNQQNRKNKRQRCGGEKIWGFQRECKVSQRNGHPKLRQVGKRSAQPTKPKEQATEVRWGENLGFLEGTQGESTRGAPKTEASRQEECPMNKTQRAGNVRWGENLGFPEGTQGESARGASKIKECGQEEHPTNKTQRAGDRGAVRRKLGVSRGNAWRVGQRGAQHRGESPRGAPNKQNPKSQR
jgi:hypothetical protein